VNDDLDIQVPDDADDLSKHAPALFALKGTEEGFLVPALYFEELSELVIAKTSIPEDGGLVVPENYFEELLPIIEAKTIIPSEDGLIVPENYFEELSSIIEAKTAIPSEDGLVVPENYFEESSSIIEAKTALPAFDSAQSDNVTPEGFVVPENYFEEFGANLESHIVLDNVKQDDGLVVPYNYFENLTDRITSASLVDFDSAQSDNTEDPNIPAGYFDALHDKVVARLESEGTISNTEVRGRVIVLAQWKKYVAITAVAASVALLIALTWTFIGNSDNGNGSLIIASNNKGLVPENYVKETPEEIIDTTSSIITVVPEGIVYELPINPPGIKLNQDNEVIMNDDEIIAQSDLMDETLVMDFVNENNLVEETDEVLDPAMMEYLMNDNTSLDVFDPGNKKP
jgi:hypothetical protein